HRSFLLRCEDADAGACALVAFELRTMTVKRATSGADYTARLSSLGDQWWKRALDVQAPYRWNLRRLELGFTLDIGCGLGRNLKHLEGRGVGIDHNQTSIDIARAAG